MHLYKQILEVLFDGLVTLQEVQPDAVLLEQGSGSVLDTIDLLAEEGTLDGLAIVAGPSR